MYCWLVERRQVYCGTSVLVAALHAEAAEGHSACLIKGTKHARSVGMLSVVFDDVHSGSFTSPGPPDEPARGRN